VATEPPSSPKLDRPPRSRMASAWLALLKRPIWTPLGLRPPPMPLAPAAKHCQLRAIVGPWGCTGVHVKSPVRLNKPGPMASWAARLVR